MPEFVKTGIEGLDSILNGGIVKNAAVLVSGNPGTGKSILGLQYLYNGVEMFDEGGIYLTFEETKDDISEAAESIGFDRWDEFVESGQIKVYDKRTLLRSGDFSSTLDTILDDLQDTQYDRLVLDSLTMFQLFFENEQEQRQYLLKFIDILKDSGLTSILTMEQSAVFPDTEIGLENFLTDGNIYLIQSPAGSTSNRYIWVAKMRKQPIKNSMFPLEIDEGGIEVYEQAAGFSMMGDTPPMFGEEDPGGLE
ncbi:RAD55 family ATPase [Halobellus limi]|uniref:Circadian regulator CirA n=1 Tax=Halobellus limi TaxID=699433 RepID=A0A1H5Z7C9_9EURY|nr:ATPase domain-containing protein [Halobellus limi]QCC48191.1 circadian regulator CirA [Halobellus limi]SEG32278.1 RecA-superfamily ATPase, KaiC/GvpD/RAD55 family [Halobellus limi]